MREGGRRRGLAFRRCAAAGAFVALVCGEAGVGGATVLEPCASPRAALLHPGGREAWMRGCVAASGGAIAARRRCEQFLQRCERRPVSPTL
jgi:hypothetical protein